MSDAPGVDPAAAADAAGDGDATLSRDPEQVMDLLAEHVPLALLMDLVTPEGPPSDELLRTEGMPDDAWWEPDADAGTREPTTGA